MCTGVATPASGVHWPVSPGTTSSPTTPCRKASHKRCAGDWTFRGGSLEAWAWTIVRRKALDLAGQLTVGPAAELPAAALDSTRDPELAAAVRALPPRRRLIVFLRYYGDLSYGEIADACGISQGTVAASLAQAHAELAQALQREGADV